MLSTISNYTDMDLWLSDELWRDTEFGLGLG